jgi:hypothetical protein
MVDQNSKQTDPPETFEQGLAWAKTRAAEKVKRQQKVLTPQKDSFLIWRIPPSQERCGTRITTVEITYSAVTGSVLKKKVTKHFR